MSNAIEIRGINWSPGKAFAIREYLADSPMDFLEGIPNLEDDIMGWLRLYVDPSPRGPGVPVQSTLFTLLALGILAGGAVRMARR